MLAGVGTYKGGGFSGAEKDVEKRLSLGLMGLIFISYMLLRISPSQSVGSRLEGTD